MLSLSGLAGIGIIGQMVPRALSVVRAPASWPPAFNDLLFGNHWYWWMAIGAVVLALLWIASNRRQKKPLLVGLIVGILLVIWVVMAQIVVTPAERLYAAHVAILHAADAGQGQKIAQYLAPDFAWGPFNRDQMAASAQAAIERFHVHGTIVRYYRSVIHERTADSEVNIFTQSDAGPVVTKWYLQWHDAPQGNWQITAVEKATFGSGETEQPLTPALSP